MNNILTCLIVGYFFGCISTSYLVGRMYHIDIREHGSGNAGTTNAMRVLGKQAGVLVYLGDCIKCALAIFIMVLIYANSDFSLNLVKLVTGFGVVLGHNYPFWLKFKGGKGIAVTSAVILIFCLPTYWTCPAICLIAFVSIIQFTGFVSLGSMAIVTIFLIYVSLVFIGDPDYAALFIFTSLFALSAFYMHKANIVRLLNGTENKFGSKKKEEEYSHNREEEYDGEYEEDYADDSIELEEEPLERFSDGEVYFEKYNTYPEEAYPEERYEDNTNDAAYAKNYDQYGGYEDEYTAVSTIHSVEQYEDEFDDDAPVEESFADGNRFSEPKNYQKGSYYN